MRQASGVIGPSESATSSCEGSLLSVPTPVTPSRSLTVLSYSRFNRRGIWVVAGTPGMQVLGVLVLPPVVVVVPPVVPVAPPVVPGLPVPPVVPGVPVPPLLLPVPAVEVLPPPGTDEPPLTFVDPETPVVPADGPAPPAPPGSAPMFASPQAATTVERAVSAPNNPF